jgi:hypothetical protein
MDWKNRLYFGDNLDILRREVPDASVDLIYLDPPFNSNATYNVLFKEKGGEDSAARIPSGALACAARHPAGAITRWGKIVRPSVSEVAEMGERHRHHPVSVRHTVVLFL